MSATGFERMQRALANSVLSRPNSLIDRLLFPSLRVVYEQGFKDGYANGYIDGSHHEEEAER